MPGYARPPQYFAEGVSFNPTTTISATNVQSAIVEVDQDVVYSSTAPESPSTGNLWIDSDTFETFAYDGASWVLVGGAGAKGGGTDKVFYENDKTITTSYTITTDKNAMSTGPVTIDSGAVITVPTGSVWSII